MKDNLFNSIAEDLSLNALFLKNIAEISLTVITEDGRVESLAGARRHVERAAPNLDKITVTDITGGTLAAFYSTTLTLLHADEESETNDDERRLLELSKKLKVQPVVSVAGYIADPALEDDSSRFEGRMSVLLPLPDLPGTKTGLPVVVNGFFALSEDRRAVKYQTTDDSSDQVGSYFTACSQYICTHCRPSGPPSCSPC